MRGEKSLAPFHTNSFLSLKKSEHPIIFSPKVLTKIGQYDQNCGIYSAREMWSKLRSMAKL